MKVAILDDYQNMALELADWSGVRRYAEITVYNDHVADPSTVVERLRPFNVVCAMRERTPLPSDILQQLPNLRLIASTGPRNASIDSQAATDLGIAVTATGYDSTPTIEFTWSMILASMRGIDREAASLRAGGWQTGLGSNLRGKSLAIVGLGNIGREVARIGLAFGMKVIAWSQNLTEEKASAAGATLVDKQTLFREADVITIHLVLSGRTRGLVGAPEFALMKPSAKLVNTSRGPIVDEPALIEALRARRIAGAAVDVFDHEPLPSDHPFRSLENVLATPHIGYVTEDLYRTFYGDAAANITKWLEVNATSA
ncbi:D-2-hydroxyacid dehydrogenase family protein [Bradyrhizobium sp. CB1650]|uniref:D-2-hydroxyacid dehydrogenase family protein n=1 Tax=Bradyrhizobium sp. CB1650 TaxID=3039153 RepID=UPI002435F4DE|nr:D-2-hydroxyacid dehydrogenase family protein [Bradyrhizobium sp. CB1650]WGD50291.1 D-2-hydroxyacid dehydrogenase family protein [Bradyrhizobium sp. CB1650]